MKVFIVNANDWYNKGDVTNRLGLILSLKKAFKDQELEVYLETLTPNEDKKYFETLEGVRVIKSIFATETRENTINIATQTLKQLIYFIILFLLAKIIPALRRRKIGMKKETKIGEILNYVSLLYNSDVIISSPGGFLHDDYPPILILNLIPLATALLLKKPLVIYNQSIGPLRSNLLRRLVETIICKSKLLTLRELKSGWKPPKGCNHVLAADSTFSIRTYARRRVKETEKIAERILQSELKNLSKEDILIGITLVGYFILSKGKEKLVKYISTIGKALRELNEKLQKNGKKVHFIVIPQNANKYELEIIEKIVSLIKKRYNVRNISFIKRDMRPEEIMAILSKVYVLIASRMHSAIFASLVSTPSVMMAYQPKFIGIAQALGLNNNVIDILSNNGTTLHEELVEKVLNTLNEREEITKKLDEATRKLEAKAKATADAMKKIIMGENKN